MQVRKFEAKTMKEALQMVKSHLGPDAVILSARDNSKGFGLLGEKSFEVTAAISEATLKKKVAAEKRLNESMRGKYQSSSAKMQKAYIDKFHEKQNATSLAAAAPTQRRYIDIQDEVTVDPNVAAEERIKGAAARALKEVQSVFDAPTAKPKAQRPPIARAMSQESPDVLSLKKEILHLKRLIAGFQNVPQNFVTRHPGAEFGLAYEMSESFQKLTQSGISIEVAVEIMKAAQSSIPQEKAKKTAIVDAWVAKYFLDQIQISDQRLRQRMHLFVGPSGQGKTASLIKFASQLAIVEKKKIAILTTDSFKLGAAEQLKIYAQILNVPFAMIRSPNEWNIIAPQLAQVDYVLIDSPGLSLKNESEQLLLKTLIPQDRKNCAVHYVQSLLAKDEDAIETANTFLSAIGIDDIILTNLDQSARHGFIFNFQHAIKRPLHSFGIGPSIPEDFEPATKERFIDLLFKLTKLNPVNQFTGLNQR